MIHNMIAGMDEPDMQALLSVAIGSWDADRVDRLLCEIDSHLAELADDYDIMEDDELFE
jgi:hypothetical protein